MASPRRDNPRAPRCIVSACLAGIDCTYRGRNNLHPRIRTMVAAGEAVAVCPEVMGGLTTPRINGEIERGDGHEVLAGTSRVMSPSGIDLTPQYVSGARACLDIARRYGIRRAILKSKSPACGKGRIYDGAFRRVLKPGNGVLASLLLQHRFTILTEHDL